ncbi:hypothetical protein EMIHUDRAFT_236390 [Emiliania huxleyi CCMP1516]|uniref:Uncharacterized protein n=3 Tax=Emiliania huxleyi TaxID=2903 RepID=A0A0D3JTL0_EMIH1|nr:hypothetical protein EMIHUDRAFT_236390 [Emiliania huxleyi CCMP1516]EOD26845.1 hypothetical protein EMIHUDRAFT_236390 [Emiliania huxleyi CCMP1516]|eukprot:XP_005779274.1 hypothetical protein EMIHUDRAFT_236390 [Emiliania huxleyi CCMP1516]
MRLLRHRLRQIVTNLDGRALRTDILTAGGMGCCGDLLCQHAVEGKQRHDTDWRRLYAVTTFEALYMGGLFHGFCQAFPLVVSFAGRKLAHGPLQATDSAAHALGCAVVDTLHDGTVMIPCYFLGVGMLQGDTLAEGRANLRREWLNSWAVGASFWMPFMYCNFAYVRPQYRVRLMAVANTVWSVLIDYMAHRSKGRLPD